MVLSTPPHKTGPAITWEPLPDDFVLPDDPVENIQQPPLADTLTDALGANGRIQADMLMGSNFGLVATINQTTEVKAPDWFYVEHVTPVSEDVIRRSYTPHLEGDPVGIVMEFLSADDNGELSMRGIPPYGKLYFYEQILQVPTCFTYNPYGPSLQVRQLVNTGYSIITPNAHGRVWIPELQLELGIWYGERLGKTTHWLRWWDKEGNLLLWSSEQAEAEKQRADLLAAKLRELGIDPDNLDG